MSGILVIAEHRRGELRPVTLELVSAAQSARAGAGGEVTVALIGAQAEALVAAVSVAGVDEIVTVPTASPDFEPAAFEAAITALIAQRQPALILVPHSIDAFSYAAALAVRAQLGFASDVFRIDYADGQLVATRGGYGQKVSVELDFPGRSQVLLAIRGSVFKPAEGAASPRVASLAAAAAGSGPASRRFIDVPATDDIDISASEFILSVGRGIGEQANVERFRELADAVGATLGCSRPIADAGWLPKSRQVGQSGKTASACKLYIAMGISGAIQHQAGMKHVGTIVAVNQDANASIFSIARYGVIADILEFSDALREHFTG